jgi:hypothetical protein
MHSLATWFGDHEETLPMLASFVRSSTTEPDPERFRRSGQSSEHEWWRKEHGFRAASLRTLVFRWPEDERVRQVAKEAIDHPWLEVREEAARSLARAFPADPDVPALLVPHLGESHEIFAEYAALMTGQPEGLATALTVLEQLQETPETRYLALDGPLYLVRYFGPLKTLGRDLKSLAARTGNPVLRKGLSAVITRFFRAISKEPG